MTTAEYAALVESINAGALQDYQRSLANQINQKELSILLGARFPPTALAKFESIERRRRDLGGAVAAITCQPPVKGK